MHRHGIPRPRRIIEEQQLPGIAVARSVHVGVLIGNHRGTNLGQHVDHTKHRFLIAWHQRRAQHNHIPITHRDLPMLPARHARQGSHGFTLRTGGDEHNLMGRHLGGVIHADNGATRNPKVAEFFGDFHVADHGATIKGHLAAGSDSRIHRGLHPVHVGGEASEDDALFRIRHDAFKGWGDGGFGAGDSRGGGVGGIAQEQVDTFVAEAGQGRQVGRSTVWWGLVKFNVAGHDDKARLGLNGDAEAVGYRVVDRPEAKVEWPSVLHGGVTHLNEFGALVVFPTFGGDQGQGEFGGNDRQVGPEFQQPRDGTNMVFMPVGDDEGVNVADFVFDGAKVGQDKVDPGFAGGGKKHAAIHDEKAVIIFENGHVAADFGYTTEGVDAQPVFGWVFRKGQPPGQVGALHGFDHIAPVTVISPDGSRTPTGGFFRGFRAAGFLGCGGFRGGFRRTSF